MGQLSCPVSLLPVNIKIISGIWDYYYDPQDFKSLPSSEVGAIQNFVLSEIYLIFRAMRDLNLYDTKSYPQLSNRIRICKIALQSALNKSNQLIRDALMFPTSQEHIQNTRKQILDRAKDLDPKKSVIVVCGSQWYGKGETVEPLKELAKKWCKKLLLVDCCESTLSSLVSIIDQPDKVVTKTMDLGRGFQDELVKLTAVAQQFRIPPNSVLESLMDLWTEFRYTSRIGSPKKPFKDVLGADNQSIDYVISSLVGSELATGHRELNWMFQLLYKQNSRDVISVSFKKAPPLKAMYFSDIVQNTNALAWSHFNSICSWVSPKGSVYIADTTTTVDIRTQLVSSKLSPEVIGSIKSFAKQVIYKTWTMPVPPVVFKVESWLMSQLNASKEVPDITDIADAKSETDAADTAATGTAAAGTSAGSAAVA